MTDLSSDLKPVDPVPRDDGGVTARRIAPERVGPTSGPAPAGVHHATRKRKVLIGALGAVVLAAALWFGIPMVRLALTTVSTDDAYVNSHVTFVAARVSGQVARVLVDDNNRVHKGDLLVKLDKEPYQVIVDEKKAAVDVANADLQAAKASVRGIEAQAVAARWKLQNAVQDVDNQTALLRARVATLDQSKAALSLAQAEFERVKALLPKGFASREVYDERQEALSTAEANVAGARAGIQQVRASLGLPAQPAKGKDLDEVPPDLDETFSSVLQAQADLIQSAAELGVVHSYDQNPKQMLAQFEAEGDIDRVFARLEAEAPPVKQAEAKVESAERDLAQAELNLRYCDVVADIDGVVTRRNVNPGDNVQVGQGLMAIRSLHDIWVDANFKETQLRDLRIGQPVDLYVDMYGGHRAFKGRISGFTMGTGSTLALLPAQNATGNFVKVVQRLPVRIDLENYDPDKYPLFVGTSVTPYVYIDRAPTGPDAGKFLQALMPKSAVSGPASNAQGTRR